MGGCRFMRANLIAEATMLTVSSAAPGVVGMPAAQANGSALAQAAGEHTAAQDQAFFVEIDSVSAGNRVGRATFRWRRASSASWEAAGLVTSTNWRTLADGVKFRWLGNVTPDFEMGDAWTILASANQGPTKLLDGDRDTAWRATGCANEHLTADLGAPALAQAMILADHNLTDQAVVTLLGDDGPNWTAPAFRQAVAVTRPHLTLFFEQTRRHWRLIMQDPTNPDGHIRASMLHLCAVFRPARNFSASHDQTLSAGRVISYNDAGRMTGTTTSLGRAFSLPFNGLDAGDRAGLEAVFNQVHDVASGRLRPFFFTPSDDAPAETFYCLPEAELELRARGLGRWSSLLRLSEVTRSDV
ncbi:hypothetical protein Deba_2733 [Desulfarculus baarsii DSM 2075]|uniref:Uncharacterized protein n=2 Tax=Desulfarculus baarsii TaxID=453230 RepID=E1QKJ4_DESB2|nr:hypothetical protein Deba_2733 [Desulfarculus baarsii DSM 2075]